MKKQHSSLFIRAASVLLVWGLAAAGNAWAGPEGDFDRGAAAHKRGDYATALKWWKPLAEQGVVNAQFNLAQMYRSGEGVAQNLATAAEWYRKAALQGDKESQYHLGAMYLNGEGVKQDEAEAHKWFTMNRHQHLHHNHAQMDQWKRQALALIQAEEARDMRKVAQRDGERILADLRASLARSAEKVPSQLALR